MSLREVQQARPDEEELKEFFLNERSNSDVNDRLKQHNAGEVSESAGPSDFPIFRVRPATWVSS